MINPTNDQDIDDLITPIHGPERGEQWSVHILLVVRSVPRTHRGTDRSAGEIRYSTNCGRNWVNFAAGPPSVMNAGILITDDAPAAPVTWSEYALPLPAALLASPTARFRFRFISSPHSGHLYLDNIGITTSTGFNEISDSQGLTIAPNPASGTFTIAHPVLAHGAHTLELLDMRGAMVWARSSVTAGPGRLQLDSHALGLKAGVYMVRLTSDLEQATGRLVVH